MYTGDIVLIVESIAERQEKYYGWKSAHESKGLKVNVMETKVTESKHGQVTVDHLTRKTRVAFVAEKQC